MKKILIFVPIFLLFLMSLIFNTDVSAHEFKAVNIPGWYEEYNKNILYLPERLGTVNGVDFHMINGVVYLEGTCTADGFISLADAFDISDTTANNLINNYQGKKLSIWWDNNFGVIDGSTGELRFFNYSGSGTSLARIWNNNVAYFTFSNTSRNFNISFMVKKNTNYNDHIIKVMLVEGEYNKNNKLSFQPNLKYIYDSGYSSGYDEGYDEGYVDGYLNGLNDYKDSQSSIFNNSKINLYFNKQKNYKKEFNPIFTNQYLKFNNIGEFIDEEYNSGNDLLAKYGNPYINISLSNEIIGNKFNFLFIGIKSIEVIFKDGNNEYIAIPDISDDTPITLSTKNKGKIITNIILEFPPNTNNFKDGYAYYINSDFNDGYNYGYETGNREGYNTGYNKGFEIGKQKGYELGMIDGGVKEDTVLLSLFLGLANIPINILTSIFNFDLFGVNLFNALTSIISVGLLIFVIRKFFK